jgi:hypothetical protein
MTLFQSILIECNLWDLGYNGQKYTWSNGREGKALTLERLDRAVANPEWSRMFDVVDVNVLLRYHFDHSPLLISFDNSSRIPWRKNKRFHFETGWVRHKKHKKINKENLESQR